eukprot:9764140-Karenia_brevis.AAC.1
MHRCRRSQESKSPGRAVQLRLLAMNGATHRLYHRNNRGTDTHARSLRAQLSQRSLVIMET